MLLPLFAAAGVVAGCKSNRKPDPPGVSVGQAESLATAGGKVSAAAALPDGRILLGTPDGVVWVWKVGDDPLPLVREDRADKPVHDGAVASIAVTRQGAEVVSVGGHLAAAWHVGKRTLAAEVGGPQRLTALAPGLDGTSVYFATEEGHVLYWKGARGEPAPVKGFACGGSLVPPARLKMRVDRRCPYGRHRVVDGQQICLYPVTLMTTQDGWLLRACRAGTLGVMGLSTGKFKWAQAGHLVVMAPGGEGITLLGRADGRLDVYRRESGEVVRALEPVSGTPTAAAGNGMGIVAVAQKDAVRLWHVGHTGALAAVSVKGRPVWLELAGSPLKLRVLTAEGRLTTHPVTVTPPTPPEV